MAILAIFARKACLRSCPGPGVTPLIPKFNFVVKTAETKVDVFCVVSQRHDYNYVKIGKMFLPGQMAYEMGGNSGHICLGSMFEVLSMHVQAGLSSISKMNFMVKITEAKVEVFVFKTVVGSCPNDGSSEWGKEITP